MPYRPVSRNLPSALAVLAVAVLLGAAAVAETKASASAQTRALIQRAEGLRIAGDLDRALRDYRRAFAMAPSAAEQRYAAVALGAAQYEAGLPGDAVETLRRVVQADGPYDALTGLGSATLAMALLTSRRAETSIEARDRLTASDRWRETAESAASQTPPGAARASIQTLVARQLIERGDAEAAMVAAVDAADALQGDASTAAPFAHVALGDALLTIGSRRAMDMAAGHYAEAALAEALRIRALAALGATELALKRERWEEARMSAMQALKLAGRGAMGDIAFAAIWTAADAAAGAGDRPVAKARYREAAAALRALRSETPLGAIRSPPARRFQGRAFQKQYLDFLLSRDSGEPELRLAIDLIEDFKIDEVEEYFSRRCVADTPRTVDVAEIEVTSAVLYPIVLDDRIEVILATRDRVERATIPMDTETLRRRVDALRYRLESPGADTRDASRVLYDALVRPFEESLAALRPATLVFAPDGPFRAVPLAALWSGESFVVERFAVATVLGLKLTDSGPLRAAASRALVGGVREAPGFPALPAVTSEVAAVRNEIGGITLLDRDFATARLERELGGAPFDIVHLASHAEFGASPEDNFVATADGRLDMNQLELLLRLRAVRDARPLGLLTLSACSTAAGAGRLALERAPLGLASVAYRSGARSVLASLWRADDRATARLMTSFYRALAQGETRGGALRKAQVEMIRSRGGSHPAFWANFILIGDWR